MAAYLKFDGLAEAPFEPSLSERFYYVGQAQHQALEHLRETLSTPGSICVLSGPSGAGKTALVRMLMRSLPGRMRLIAIDDPRLSAPMLLATILRASGVMATSLESPAELTFKLRTLLEEQTRLQQLTTVIIDEAQGLSFEVLEQLRLISNLEGRYGRMINFLLVGQEDLLAALEHPSQQMLRGRIRLFAALKPFTREETAVYLSFRLQQAGRHEPLFTDKAAARLTKLCRGLPRLINAAADAAMQQAAAKEKNMITAAVAQKGFAAAQAGAHFRRRSLKRLGRALKSMFAPRIVISAAAAIAASAACFAGLLLLLRPFIAVQSFEHALKDDPAVFSAANRALPYLLSGTSQETALQGHLRRAVSAALFADDALSTLIGLEGMAAAPGESPLNCQTLPAAGLSCALGVRSLRDLEKLNYPALIELYDDELTPFFAVLLHLNEQQGELIIGREIFTVSRDYLEREAAYRSLVLYRTPPIGDLSILQDAAFSAGSGALLEQLRALTPEGRRYLRERLEPICKREQWGLCDFSLVTDLSAALFNYAARVQAQRFDADFYLKLEAAVSDTRPYLLHPQSKLQPQAKLQGKEQ